MQKLHIENAFQSLSATISYGVRANTEAQPSARAITIVIILFIIVFPFMFSFLKFSC